MYLKALTMIKVVSGLTLSMLSYSSFAASTLIVPEEIIVVAINDQKVKPSFLKSKKEFQVEPGPLQIQLRYQEYFENNLAQHDILKSDLVQLSVANVQDQQRYQLKLQNAPQSYEAAKQYMRQPDIVIVHRNGQLLPQQSATRLEQKTSLLDNLLGQKEDENRHTSTVSQPLTKQPISATSLAASNSSSTQFLKVEQPFQSVDPMTADQHLKQIWQKATKQERQKFMSWLAEQ